MKTAIVVSSIDAAARWPPKVRYSFGHLEPIDDPDQAPRELGVDRQPGVARQSTRARRARRRSPSSRPAPGRSGGASARAGTRRAGRPDRAGRAGRSWRGTRGSRAGSQHAAGSRLGGGGCRRVHRLDSRRRRLSPPPTVAGSERAPAGVATPGIVGQQRDQVALLALDVGAEQRLEAEQVAAQLGQPVACALSMEDAAGRPAAWPPSRGSGGDRSGPSGSPRASRSRASISG